MQSGFYEIVIEDGNISLAEVPDPSEEHFPHLCTNVCLYWNGFDNYIAIHCNAIEERIHTFQGETLNYYHFTSNGYDMPYLHIEDGKLVGYVSRLTKRRYIFLERIDVPNLNAIRNGHLQMEYISGSKRNDEVYKYKIKTFNREVVQTKMRERREYKERQRNLNRIAREEKEKWNQQSQ